MAMSYTSYLEGAIEKRDLRITELERALAEANARAEAVDVNAIRRVIAALESCDRLLMQVDTHHIPGAGDVAKQVAAVFADPAIRPYLPTGQAGLEQAGETA